MKFQSAYDDTPDFINTGYKASPLRLKIISKEKIKVNKSVPDSIKIKNESSGIAKWGYITGEIINLKDLIQYIDENAGGTNELTNKIKNYIDTQINRVNLDLILLINLNKQATKEELSELINNQILQVTTTLTNYIYNYVEEKNNESIITLENYIQEYLVNLLDSELFLIVDTLPTENIKENKIYLLVSDSSKLELYRYKNGSWEKLGILDWNQSDGTYSPDDSIPNSFMSTSVGNLEATTKAELKGQTFSAILDKILFKDVPSFVNYGTNSLKANKSVEVGTAITILLFQPNPGTVTYGYPESSKKWIYTSINIIKTVALFGNNSNVASCNFTFTKPSITLVSAQGKSSSIQLENKTQTIYSDITGFYNIAFKVGEENISLIADSPIGEFLYKKQISSTNTVQIGEDNANGLQNSSFVYCYLPVGLKLLSVLIRNGLTGAYELTTNFGIKSRNISIVDLSTINNYNCYYIAKSSNNADNTVTANSAPLKINIST